MSKKKTIEGGGGVNLSYIITPFLDMSFQLLAFFIMTYHSSALEGHIDGKLVPPSLVAVTAKNPVPMNDLPSDADPDAAETLLIIVKSVDKNQVEGNLVHGDPSQILLKKSEDPQPNPVADSSDGPLDVGLKKLEAELKRLLQQPGAVKSNIKIEGDGDLKHKYIMRVYDVCKQSGYQNISFVAPKFVRPKAD